MQCADLEPLLPAYADDALSRRERDAVVAHLAGCNACRTELEKLHASLQALNGAVPRSAPDLWSRFHVRLVREPVNGRDCRWIVEQLPAYVEGELDQRESAAVEFHLEACGPCADEEALLRRSARALRSAARSLHHAETPDLWASFSAKLAETVSCEEVDRTLPAYFDSELAGSQVLAVRQHLDSCSRCAAEAAVYTASLEALGRAGAAPQVDLWPAFQARLEAEERRAEERSWKRRFAAGLGVLLRPQVLQPALGIAAFVGIVAVGLSHLSIPSRGLGVALVETGPEAVAPAPDRRPEPDKRRVAAAPAAPDAGTGRKSGIDREPARGDTGVTADASGPAARTPETGTLLARGPVTDWTEPVVTDVAPPAPKESWSSQLRVAYNSTVRPPDPGAFDVNTADAQEEIMPEVVRAVEGLADVEDAIERPFETSNNAL